MPGASSPLLRIPPAEQLNIARHIAEYHNACFERAQGRYIVVNLKQGVCGIARTRMPTGRETLNNPFFKVQAKRVSPEEVLNAIFPRTLDDAIREGHISGPQVVRSNQK